MSKRYQYFLVILLPVVLLTGLLVYAMWNNKVTIKQYTCLDREAKIHPDYCATVIPPNIAPLNFMVTEEGKRYYVKIYSRQGRPIEVFSRTAKIIIPDRSWRKLLNQNRGQELHFDIFVQNQNNQWHRFAAISNKIANEDIDGFVVYRKMHPTHTHFSGPMGIYQRNLANFDEKVILDRSFDKVSCLNCHTFCKNHPDKMLLGVRSYDAGYAPATLLIDDGKLYKIGAKFGYSSWHPSGRLAAYTIINLPMYFHFRSARDEVRDTIDIDSALAYYLVDKGMIKTSPQFSRKERLETWPAWSADGRYLYFCSTPVLWPDLDLQNFPPKQYKQVKYDLVRISYDLDHDKWGELETVLSAQDTGLSIAMPHISPDGQWLIFSMCDYGFFPTWQKSSDLYIIDLKKAEQTGKYEYRRLEINSDQSESWQSFSSNNRWIVFSSKRDYGVFTRLYFSYIDTSGRVHKPLLLPQKDPEFYNQRLLTYNTPEFTTESIKHVKGKLAQVFRGTQKIKVDIPITMATPKPAAAAGQQSPRQQRE